MDTKDMGSDQSNDIEIALANDEGESELLDKDEMPVNQQRDVKAPGPVLSNLDAMHYLFLSVPPYIDTHCGNNAQSKPYIRHRFHCQCHEHYAYSPKKCSLCMYPSSGGFSSTRI